MYLCMYDVFQPVAILAQAANFWSRSPIVVNGVSWALRPCRRRHAGPDVIHDHCRRFSHVQQPSLHALFCISAGVSYADCVRCLACPTSRDAARMSAGHVHVQIRRSGVCVFGFVNFVSSEKAALALSCLHEPAAQQRAYCRSVGLRSQPLVLRVSSTPTRRF